MLKNVEIVVEKSYITSMYNNLLQGEVKQMSANNTRPVNCTHCGTSLGNLNANILTLQCFCGEVMTIERTPLGNLNVRSTESGVCTEC